MTTRSTPLRLPSAPEQVLAQAAQRIGFAAAERIQIGCLTVVLPDGSRRVFGDRTSERRAQIQFHDNRALAHLLLHGETGAGEAYMDGGWSSPDLPALLELAALNRSSLALSAGWWRVPGQISRTLAHRRFRSPTALIRRGRKRERPASWLTRRLPARVARNLSCTRRLRPSTSPARATSTS